jgi:hypothetical protein
MQIICIKIYENLKTFWGKVGEKMVLGGVDRFEERWGLERKQERMGPRMDNGWGDGPKEKVGLRKR